ncbi:hypothetical protein ES288_D01G194100v1 [Gossypium darwinii]|uniref:Uncharacterized protein n=1 Tax=Gossypium darwinii TaxID=34276 RepID=A0A5D2DS71_GOSDA|nr:hypothetical protein ES288_D01G194100v1 [Gossypium darwinii]
MRNPLRLQFEWSEQGFVGAFAKVLVYGGQLGVRGMDGGGRTEACVVGAAAAAEAD